MNEHTETVSANGASDRGVRWMLGLSAVVLSVLIVAVGGRGLVAPAQADVTTLGGLTMTNLQSGTNEDVIALLDGREERLFIYQVVNAKDLNLVSSEDLRDLFAKAKAAASGNR